MDLPCKITAEMQRNLWSKFHDEAQEFKAEKERFDNKFLAELDRLKSNLSRIQ